MGSLNEVRIMGNLGRDPELRYTQSGTAVCTLSIATTRKYKREGETELVEDTEWHRVVVWGKAAEAIERQKKVGDQILIRGYLRTHEYVDKEGVKRWSTEIIAGDWQRSGVVFTGRAPTSGRPPHPADDPGRNEDYIPSDPSDDDIPF